MNSFEVEKSQQSPPDHPLEYQYQAHYLKHVGIMTIRSFASSRRSKRLNKTEHIFLKHEKNKNNLNHCSLLI